MLSRVMALILGAPAAEEKSNDEVSAMLPPPSELCCLQHPRLSVPSKTITTQYGSLCWSEKVILPTL